MRPDWTGKRGKSMAGPSMLEIDLYSVFMCRKCNTILAEGGNACESNDVLDLIAFLAVSTDVEVEEGQRYDVSPDLQGCVYSYLRCGVCKAKVGLFLTCAVAEVSHLRKLFCIFRKSVLCYSLKTKNLLEGERFYFNAARCVAKLGQLEQDMFHTYSRIQDLANIVQLQLQSSEDED
ncbi:hypothetical protein GDO81_001372 [Engystomops pustulosus]|uniref:Mis18 domain-containing protein n=1 Tax=Engystomops pustulosus TaxID=76066 RepID=A0AAV7DBR6_ENGPU|nr:hypothetical protein GDO81_001372 [Engystomops pustulosus]